MSKDKKQKIILSLSFIILGIIYFMYMYYYHKEITIDSFITHTVRSINILVNDIKYVINKLLSYKEVLHTCVIAISIIIIIKDTHVGSILKNITNFEAGPVKIGLVGLDKENAESKLEEIKQDSEHEHINETNNSTKDLCFERNKINIMELIIENPEIVEIIEKFIKNSRATVIPINLIHSRYKIEIIDVLFNWEHKPNSIKITSVKEEMYTALVDVYAEFKSKNIIYSTQ